VNETHTVKAKIGEIENTQAAGGEPIPELAGASLTEAERRGAPRAQPRHADHFGPGEA